MSGVRRGGKEGKDKKSRVNGFETGPKEEITES